MKFVSNFITKFYDARISDGLFFPTPNFSHLIYYFLVMMVYNIIINQTLKTNSPSNFGSQMLLAVICMHECVCVCQMSIYLRKQVKQKLIT